MTIRCRVNWQQGVNLGVSFAAKNLLDIAAVSGRSRTIRLSEYAQMPCGSYRVQDSRARYVVVKVVSKYTYHSTRE
jgi:hypothetical protein